MWLVSFTVKRGQLSTDDIAHNRISNNSSQFKCGEKRPAQSTSVSQINGPF